MGPLIKLLQPLRRWTWLDWILTRLESYTALLEQWGYRPSGRTVLEVLASVVLGAWAYAGGAGLPVGIAIAVVVSVVLWSARQKPSAHSPPAHADKPAESQLENSAQIEKNRLNDQIRTLGRSTHWLVGLKIDELIRDVMARLVADAPKYDDGEDISGDEDEMKDRTFLLQEYIRRVASNLDGSQWRYDFEIVCNIAEADEDQRLKQSPEALATGINTFVYRDYAIAMAKRRRVIGFLKKAIEESLRSELQYISKFRDEKRLLDPRIFH